MIKPIFEELAAARPKRHFTVGIYDDVTHLSLPIDGAFRIERPAGEVQAVFFGLGSDGTVGANKASVKIIGESTDLFAQGYFVYDSKKSGSITVSHLRFGPEPIRSTYLVEQADFVACHQFGMLGRTKVLESAKHGATFLLNAPYGPDEVWDHLPGGVQRQLIDKEIDFWVIDALAVAAEAGMGSRINTVMQPCFFKLAGILPPDEAIAQIKAFVKKTYAKRGEAVVARNFAAIDRSLARLGHVTLGDGHERATRRPRRSPTTSPTSWPGSPSRLIAGDGDQLPVSALPVDGTFPTGTTQYEKRAIAQTIPIWDPAICIDCGKCAMVCPHATIRMKVFPTASVEAAPVDFLHKEFRSRELPDHRLTIQVAPDDCTGCGVCVDVCPAKSKTDSSHKAINMEPVAEHRDVERERWDFFQSIPRLDRDALPARHGQGLAGPRAAVRVLGRLRRLRRDAVHPARQPALRRPHDRGQRDGLLVDLRRQPADDAVDRERRRRGPAWSNSLFEDNAEFGLGMRLALDAQTDQARRLLERLAPRDRRGLGARAPGRRAGHRGRDRRSSAIGSLACVTRSGGSTGRPRPMPGTCWRSPADLVRQGVWIIGGDGWAYDIGFGGVDQVLSSGRNVNILVLDTEVYSNTGGQSSKATPRGAVAKFAAAGKGTAKKDLGAIARSYGNVYVAQVSMGANDQQTTKALLEADAWPGPSLVIAYSTCIAHGIDMSKSMTHQKDAVKSGYWPLYRFHPSEVEGGKPFKLDSSTPSIPIADFVATETRFAVLQRTHPERAAELATLAQADADERWRYYEQLAGIERTVPHLHRPDPEIVRRGRERRRLSIRGRRRRGMTVDLTTRYLGLELRSPIVASAAPHNADPAMARRLDRAGVGAIVLPVAVRGGDRRRGDRAHALARTGHGGLRRGARLLPGGRVVHGRRRPVPRRARAGQGVRRGPDHRQPQREQPSAAG